jgi:ferredoxin
MKILVDWDKCESHGQCEFAAPDVFSINDEGDLDVLDETPDDSLRSSVEEAIRRCPTRAITLEG